MTGTDAYVSGITYSRLGKVTAMTYGNGLVTSYDYYDTVNETDPSSGTTYSYRMKSVQVGAAGAVMNLSYTYDKNGNVKTRTDGQDATHSETYTYDDLNRLLSASSTVYGNLAYAYDQIDNITSFEGKTYSYNTNGTRPHAVTGNTVFTYLYDANGNMTSRSDGRTMVYDGYNRVSSISDGGSYEYSDGEQRVKKTEGTLTTYYFFGSYEEEYTSGTLSNVVKYYSVNGQSIAQRSSAEGLVYVHSDHLGSSSVLTNAAGTVVLRRGFKPYGEQAYQTGTAAVRYQFTGQEKESNGLYYYGARYYDPSLGRFTSADTVLDGLNRYGYCGNNPTNYTDPTGHIFGIDDLVVAAFTSAFVSIAVAGVTAIVNGIAQLSEIANGQRDHYDPKETQNAMAETTGYVWQIYSNAEQEVAPLDLSFEKMYGTTPAGSVYENGGWFSFEQLYPDIGPEGERLAQAEGVDALPALGVVAALNPAAIAAAIAAGSSLLLRGSEMPSYIFRTGSGNATNLTPRPAVYNEKGQLVAGDPDGLSYTMRRPTTGPYTETTVEAVNATKVLYAVHTPTLADPTHHSIRPLRTADIGFWAATRSGLINNPGSAPIHPYTLILQGISTRY